MEYKKLPLEVRVGGAPFLAAVAAGILYNEYGEDARSLPPRANLILRQLARYFAFAATEYTKVATTGRMKPPQ